MKKILIIGCGKDQIKLIKAAQYLGFKVLGVDREKKNKKNVDEFINISTYDVKNILKYLKKKKIERLVALITNASSRSLITAAKIAKKFSLLSMSYNIAECSLSKKKLYNYCKKKNIPTIETFFFNKKKKLNKNFILKPDQPLVGKTGVYFFKKNSLLSINKINEIKKNSLNSKVVMQPFISGLDIGLLIASSKGKVLWNTFFK